MMAQHPTSPPPDKRPLERLREVAHNLDVSVPTVRRIIARGDIAAVRVGNQLRVEPAERERYIRRQRARALCTALDKDE